MVSCLCLNACSPACCALAAEDNCPVASLETNMGHSALAAAANNDFLARDKTRMNNNCQLSELNVSQVLQSV